jgi:fumarate reductase flavoprotein subunit
MKVVKNLTIRAGLAFIATLAIAFAFSVPLKAVAAAELEANVVIIGSGGAGISAGVVALQKGAGKVIILEKQSYLGANSALAGGMLYSPGKSNSFGAPQAGAAKSASVDPKEAANAAIKETIEFNHYELIDPKLVRVLINESISTGKWFKDLGIDTDANAGAPGSFGKSLKPLAEKFKSLGGQIMMNTTAKKILRDASGRVNGVIATDKEGKELSIKTGSVVLASGGFTGNAGERCDCNG